MIIRDANKNDVRELVQMSLELITSELDYDRNLRIPSEDELYNFWNRIINSRRHMVLVAEKEELMGYAYGWFMRDYFIFRKQRAYLSDVFVKQNFRGMGVGSSLVNELLKVFRENGVKFVYVDVYSRNTHTLKFWKKNGFEVESFTLVREL